MIFADTSALYALLVENDEHYARARAAFEELHETADDLLTTSHVLQETTALLQVRSGLPAVRDLHERIRPLLLVEWIDEPTHDLAMNALIASSSRKASLTDHTSFLVMRRRGVDTAFAFDPHFRRHGFRTLP